MKTYNEIMIGLSSGPDKGKAYGTDLGRRHEPTCREVLNHPGTKDNLLCCIKAVMKHRFPEVEKVEIPAHVMEMLQNAYIFGLTVGVEMEKGDYDIGSIQ